MDNAQNMNPRQQGADLILYYYNYIARVNRDKLIFSKHKYAGVH